MTKTILEEYLQAYSKQLMANSELVTENSELIQKVNVLEKKLKIATKALEEYMTFCRHPAEEALKEMKGVK